MSRPAALLRRLIPERWRPIGYLNNLTHQRTRGKVLAGPFAGMKYGSQSHGSAYIPKLIGIYERELSYIVESIVSRAPRLVVDVGAAEGYYAVGLAKRLPDARVIAFEMEPDARNALHDMATLNGVAARVEIRGKCEPQDLADALGDGTSAVVVCDAEGYERVLLDPDAVRALERATVLVELHEFLDRGIGDELTRRFATTHTVVHVRQEDRARSEYPYSTAYTRAMPARYLNWSVSEWRPETMDWLWLSPRLEGQD